MEVRKINILEFETKSNKYLFDGNTGYIIPRDDLILHILNHLQDKPTDIYNKYKNKSYIDMDRFMIKYNHVQSYLKNGIFCEGIKIPFETSVEKLAENSSTAHLILVLTEDCNLRCEYCIYSDKYPKEIEYSLDSMSYQTVVKSIDIFYELYNSRKQSGMVNKPCLSFYGGEPLLNYKILKKATEYAKSKIDSLQFYVTTNGTIFSDEIITYLVDNDFYIGFSLDGNEENHDRNRITKSGNPTFEIVLENIKKIQKYKQKRKITKPLWFNCCYDNYTDMFKVYDFFVENYELFNPYLIMFSRILPSSNTYYDWCDT
ncbi:MAG: radical SAM protein, partial [Clostridiales bacterium]|nr:radical SAM protein [Clostridiales bacterium]